MPARLLHFRFTSAALACFALLAAAVLDTTWLAIAGVAAAAASELVGLLQARSRLSLPVERTLRGAAEACPAIGIAAFEPAAIGITIAVVLYALMASGIQTVGIARGVTLSLTWGESLRRTLTCVASVVALAVPLAAAGWLNLPRITSLELMACLFVIVATAGGATLVEMWAKISLAGKSLPAQNVDT